MTIFRPVGVSAFNAPGPNVTTRKIIPDASWRPGDAISVAGTLAGNPVITLPSAAWRFADGATGPYFHGTTFSEFLATHVYTREEYEARVLDSTWGWTFTTSVSGFFACAGVALPGPDLSQYPHALADAVESGQVVSQSAYTLPSIDTSALGATVILDFAFTRRSTSLSAANARIDYASGQASTKIVESYHISDPDGSTGGHTLLIGERNGSPVAAATSYPGAAVTTPSTRAVFAGMTVAYKVAAGVTAAPQGMPAYRKLNGVWTLINSV